MKCACGSEIVGYAVPAGAWAVPVSRARPGYRTAGDADLVLVGEWGILSADDVDTRTARCMDCGEEVRQ